MKYYAEEMAERKEEMCIRDRDKAGMPIGIQMIGDCFGEHKILRAAAAYEAVRGAFPAPEKGGKKA